MKRSLFAGVALLVAAMLSGVANAQDTIKIGVVSAFSGQFADTSAQIDNGIKLYMKQHGDKVAGKKIEIIRKATGGPNPDVAKRLAQELVHLGVERVQHLRAIQRHAQHARIKRDEHR